MPGRRTISRGHIGQLRLGAVLDDQREPVHVGGLGELLSLCWRRVPVGVGIVSPPIVLLSADDPELVQPAASSISAINARDACLYRMDTVISPALVRARRYRWPGPARRGRCTGTRCGS